MNVNKAWVFSLFFGFVFSACEPDCGRIFNEEKLSTEHPRETGHEYDSDKDYLETFEGCKEVDNLYLIGYPESDLAPLAQLERIESNLVLTSDSTEDGGYATSLNGLVTLIHLQNLTHVGGNIRLDGTPLLGNLFGLAGIKEVYGDILIMAYDEDFGAGPLSIEGLSIEFAHGNVFAPNYDKGLEDLIHVAGNLSISAPILKHMTKLTHVGGTLTLYSDNLTELEPLQKVSHLGGLFLNSCEINEVDFIEFASSLSGSLKTTPNYNHECDGSKWCSVCPIDW